MVYPVPSCGGYEGRGGGVNDGAEGEDGECVPASCAGGAGNGDGGEGDAAVPWCAGTGGVAAISGGGGGGGEDDYPGVLINVYLNGK